MMQILKKLCQTLVILVFMSPLGGCTELFILALGGELTQTEADFLGLTLKKEESQTVTKFADFKKQNNNIYRDPLNYLAGFNLGFNADQLSRNTYPGLFCGTGSGVSSSLRGVPFNVTDIPAISSQLQGRGISNPTLAQITSVCGSGSSGSSGSSSSP